MRSRVIEYYRPVPGPAGRQLAAVCLTDFLSDGVSMVYSFFDPDLQAVEPRQLHHPRPRRHRRRGKLPYVYLGYWVPGSAKMDYKARFQPLEIFADGRWTPLADIDAAALARRRGDRTAISEQVAAIELPSTR